MSLAAGDLLAPAAFREAVARVRPSLVTIVSLGGVTPGRTGGVSNPGEGPTTGLIVSPDGYIVTSTFNFIGNPRVITVILPDRTRHIARLLGRDETRNICVLKIDGVHDLPVPEFAPVSGLRVGQWAISVGVGYGDGEPAISAGIVSALNRVGGRAIQTDANISPANYGGPLVDLDGRAIGVCVPLNPLSRGVAAGVEWYDSGIGFAIPLSGSEPLLLSLRSQGTVIRPAWLGVQVRGGGDATPGVILAAVKPDSAAAKAGLRLGDRIISVDGEKILDAMQLKTVLDRHIEGDRISLQVRRGDDKLTVVAQLAAPVAEVVTPRVRKPARP